jgi:hypothetical protein
MSNNKNCNAPTCSVLLISDDEDKIKCGLCKGEYHGCCVGLPRKWCASSTTMTRFIMNHFICQTCKALPDLVVKFDNIWTKKFNDLGARVTELNNTTLIRLKANEEVFKELSDNVESFSTTMSNIEEHQRTTAFAPPPFETTIMHELAKKLSRTIETQTDFPVTSPSPRGEWRTLNSARIWRNDWTQFDEKKKTKDIKIKQRSEVKNNTKDPPTKKLDNYYNILTQNESDPIAHCSKDERFLRPSTSHNKSKKKTKSLKKNASQAQRQDADDFDAVLNDYNLNFFEPASVPSSGHALKYPNFNRGPIINQSSHPQHFKQQQQLTNPLPPPSSTTNMYPGGLPTSKSWATVAAGIFNTNNAATYTTPLTTQSFQPQQLTSSITTSSEQPESTTFMDPLMPAVVKNTIMSVKENGRYMLARLRDAQLLRTVRLYLSYLHDHPSACIDGLTAHHCKLLLGINGLPTDVRSLKNIYYEFNCTFNFNFDQSEIEKDLRTLRGHLSSDRLNHLQRSNENFKKFYNF